MSEVVQPHEDRTDVDWIAFIRLADGTDHPCAITEVSASSLTISAAEDLILPQMFMVKVVGRQLVFRVQQAWRRGHHIGVHIDKIAKLPEAPHAPIEHIEPPPAAPETYTRLGTRRHFHPS